MIILKKTDGSVAIMSVTPGADVVDAVKKFRDCHPEFTSYIETDIKLPSREFRDAWKLNNRNEIVVDKKKAMDIHMARIRSARDEQLEKLDREQLRYLGRDQWKPKEIEAKKQLLRDLPATINSLDWPEGL